MKKPLNQSESANYPTYLDWNKNRSKKVTGMLVSCVAATCLTSCSSLSHDVRSKDEYSCLSEQDVKYYYKFVFDLRKAAIEVEEILSGITMGMETNAPQPVWLRLPVEDFVTLKLEDSTLTGVALSVQLKDEGIEKRVRENRDEIVEIMLAEMRMYVKRRIQIPRLWDLELKKNILKKLKLRFKWWGEMDVAISGACPPHR